MIKLSVITPTFNRNFIKDAWKSLEAQQSRDFEWIIVDNGSNQEHLKLLEHIRKNASFPVVVVSESKRGAAAARRRGESVSSAQYISYLDDDDLYSPDTISCWISDLEKNSSDMSIIKNCKLFFPFHLFRIYLERNNFDPNKFISTEFERFKLPFTQSFVCFAYRRDFSLKSGSWNTDLTSREDMEYLFKIIALNPKITASEGGTYYIRRENIVKYENRKAFESVLESFKLTVEKIRGHKYENYVRSFLGADTRNRWRKISLIYPDLGEKYAEFAASLGFPCTDSILKRRIMRFIKTPFRRIALLAGFFLYIKSILWRR